MSEQDMISANTPNCAPPYNSSSHSDEVESDDASGLDGTESLASVAKSNHQEKNRRAFCYELT